MIVAILTGHPDNPYAADVLQAINAHGIRGIHVVAAAWNAGPRSFAGVIRAHGARLPWVGARWLAKCLIRPFGRIVRRRDATGLAAEVERHGGHFVRVRDANGEECRNALTALDVDILVLAGAPIVRPNILAVPRVGTLNAHQGALPGYRGMNVIEWAILEGDTPAVTVHFVDSGVDTGDIIASEEIGIVAGDSLQSIRARAADKQAELLARAVFAARSRPLPRRAQRQTEGRQYYSMHPRLRAVAERRLAESCAAPRGSLRPRP